MVRTWHVVRNDVVGGWCVASRRASLSELRTASGADIVIADTISETEAGLIAEALDRMRVTPSMVKRLRPKPKKL